MLMGSCRAAATAAASEADTASAICSSSSSFRRSEAVFRVGPCGVNSPFKHGRSVMSGHFAEQLVAHAGSQGLSAPKFN